MVVSAVATMVLTAGSYVRSMLHLASADVKGSPLWNLTPWRSLNVHVVWFWSFHSVASPGYSLPSGWRLVRLSKRLKETRISLEFVLKCGSNFEMSPPWAVTSSRFCVVWACASRSPAAGTIPAAPSTAAPLSNSRRVTFMRCTSEVSSITYGGDTAFAEAVSSPLHEAPIHGRGP